MSIESLEEMLKKQFPQQQPRENYVLREVVSTPQEPIASPAEMQRHFAKPTDPNFKPRRYEDSKLPEPTKNMDVPTAYTQSEIAAPQRTAQPSQSAPQEKSFAEMISELQRSPSQAPREDIYGSTETEIQRLKSQRSGSGGDGWIDLLGMAIPTVVGASVGQLGAGAVPAGEYGIARGKEMRAQDQKLEEMIAKLASDRAKALGRQKEAADPVKTFLGPDGQPYALRLSQGNALGLPEFREGSFKDLKFTDEEGKERIALLDQKQGNLKQTDLLAGKDKARNSGREERLASEFETRIKLATRDKLNQDSDFKTQKTRVSATSDAINVLNRRNPIGDAGVTTIFAKGIFGDVGNITQDERAAYIGNPMLEQTFKRLYDKYLVTGKLEETDRADLMNLAVGMRDHAVRRSREIADNYIKSTGAVGIDPTDVINPLLNQTLVQPQAAPKQPEKKKASAPKTFKPVSEMTDKEVEEYLKAKGEL